jgi:PAB1-binding protein PBP1
MNTKVGTRHQKEERGLIPLQDYEDPESLYSSVVRNNEKTGFHLDRESLPKLGENNKTLTLNSSS